MEEVEEKSPKFLPESNYHVDKEEIESVQQFVSKNNDVQKEEVVKEEEEDIKPTASENPFNFYSYFSKSTNGRLPLIYSPEYNISFMGLEKLHPFDSCKYSKIVAFLKESGVLKNLKIIKVIKKPTPTHLLFVHTPQYIESLNNPATTAQVTELYFIAMLPGFLVQKYVLDPFLFATAGSILAGHIAMKRGWAINLGGGFHHCCYNEGGGFCAYSDITLCYRYVRHHYPQVKKVMIIDLDAHQGNGHERDKLRYQDEYLFIVDMYNSHIYPGDQYAKKAIDIKIPVDNGIEDKEYLDNLRNGLVRAFAAFVPDFIVYNAGTDILIGDTLGLMSVSPAGVIERDSIVFEYALNLKVPIVMFLSGGYQQTNAKVISDSIINLDKTYNLLKETKDTEELIICTRCSKSYHPEENRKGECAHTKTWHSNYSDCSYVKCGMGLGPLNIGKQHWGCCYSTDVDNKVCEKSEEHSWKEEKKNSKV